MGNKTGILLSFEEGMTKARRFCAYQERCVSELEEKMKEWRIARKDRDAIIDSLVDDNFINEQRFAQAYVSGKFRIRSWGRLKIRAALKSKKIPPRLIENALGELDETSYRKTMVRLLEKKISETGDPGHLRNRNKILWYLLAKGYEKELVLQEIRKHAGA